MQIILGKLARRGQNKLEIILYHKLSKQEKQPVGFIEGNGRRS